MAKIDFACFSLDEAPRKKGNALFFKRNEPFYFISRIYWNDDSRSWHSLPTGLFSV